jgi:hypothetical protein
MLRLDMRFQAWHRIIHCAGEPAMECLRGAAPTNHEDGSDILVVLPSVLFVADVFVIHPATTSYSCAATQIAGSAPASRDALKRRQCHAGGLPTAPLLLSLVDGV